MANIYDKIEELKRLQKEIDEANEESNNIVVKNWGKKDGYNDEDSRKTLILYNKIQGNQSKIKQIIEEL